MISIREILKYLKKKTPTWLEKEQKKNMARKQAHVLNF